MIHERDTAAEIREALALRGTVDSTRAVKRAVMGSIMAVDASVSIETTDYFNHSFAPDLVLTWEPSSSTKERFVYLRFNDDPLWITEELPRLQHRHPVVYGLAPTKEGERSDTLASRSTETETLVTDPAGVDQLAEVPSSGVASFVSRTLIRGGKGLVDERRAERATSEISGGFEAARAADADGTKSAAEAALHFLRPREAGQLVGFFHAMWIGAGGSEDTFPVEGEASGDPGDEGLRFLIEHEEIADPAFWRGLGASLSIERLSRLGVTGSPANLQHIVNANLSRLWARAVRVKRDQPRLDESGEDLLWRLESGLLALGGGNFIAYVGANADDIAGVRVEEHGYGVAVEDLRERARAQTVTVDSLELTNGQRIVTYGSADQSDVAGDMELAELAAALGSARIQKATVSVGGRHLDLDFRTATASARTSGRPPVTDILRVALPLLWPLTERDWVAFAGMIAEARTWQTFELFPGALGLREDDGPLELTEGESDEG